MTRSNRIPRAAATAAFLGLSTATVGLAASAAESPGASTAAVPAPAAAAVPASPLGAFTQILKPLGHVEPIRAMPKALGDDVRAWPASAMTPPRAAPDKPDPWIESSVSLAVADVWKAKEECRRILEADGGAFEEQWTRIRSPLGDHFALVYRFAPGSLEEQIALADRIVRDLAALGSADHYSVRVIPDDAWPSGLRERLRRLEEEEKRLGSHWKANPDAHALVRAEIARVKLALEWDRLRAEAAKNPATAALVRAELERRDRLAPGGADKLPLRFRTYLLRRGAPEY